MFSAAVISATLSVFTIGTYIEAKKFDEPPIIVRFHSENETELMAEKDAEWESGGLSASLTAVKRTEKEAKELEEDRDEDRELGTQGVRKNDADGDSSRHGTGGQEESTQEDEGDTEVPEEDAAGNENTSGESEVPEETTQTAGEDVGTFEMTAYIAFCDTGCTGVTASGYDVSNTIYSPEGLRIVAADPEVLPLGSVVEISSGGNTIQAVVMDTGGDINGNRLDLLVESEAEAWDFGRQGVEVRVLSY